MKFLPYLLLFSTLSAAAQLAPSKEQHQQLVSQKHKLLALQAKILELQAEQTFGLTKMQNTCHAIAFVNRWPEGTQCDPQSLGFAERPVERPRPAEPATPAPAPQPAPPTEALDVSPS